jgi:hypothetical protein
MYFSVIQSFGPQEGERWERYCAWRGLGFTAFESIDAIMCPSRFSPKTAADWQHAVCEDFKTHLIADEAYARTILERSPGCRLVAVGSPGEPCGHRFCGYDVIDGWWEVSLLSNWGNDMEMVNRNLGANGLISSLPVVTAVHRWIMEHCGKDSHAAGSRIVSVHEVASRP